MLTTLKTRLLFVLFVLVISSVFALPAFAGASSDADSDNVPDTWDVCKTDTNLMESVPLLILGTNRFALNDGDVIFDTTPSQNNGSNRQYSLDGSFGSSTCGCSCEQILVLHPGDIIGGYFFGCSIGTMDVFVKRNCEVDNDADGYMISEGDCNDSNPGINPGQEELCNGIDDDCDGIIPADETDDDSDGIAECEGDCNDTIGTVYPGAPELCDGLDTNCDGSIPSEEDDSDEDGFRICEGDCNDTIGTVYPGAPELCDGLDTNCDGLVDINESDNDGDGFSVCNWDCNDDDPAINPLADEVCDGIDNDCDILIDEGFDADYDEYSICAGDCDDNDNETNPGFREICDGKDNDCDGNVDEGADEDGDGYESWYDCGNDCNDNDASINPASSEVCDGIDNDCDGQADEGVEIEFFTDADGDGYGTSETTLACSLPEGYATETGDCEDTNPSSYPGAEEVCDGIDNDCDGEVDEGVQLLDFYEDSDSDGFGQNTGIVACSAPLGYIQQSGDCNDNDTGVNPASEEVCDMIDNNCDGQVDEDQEMPYYLDRDGDGYGGAEMVLACSAPEGYAEYPDDCDDADDETNPGADEVCDGIDNDCDGEVDEGLPYMTLYLDADHDGHGSSFVFEVCTVPDGFAENSSDCDDLDGYVNPDAEEICDGIDNDCDGQVDEGIENDTYYQDADGDGFGGSASTEACTRPEGYVSSPGDCNDSDPEIKPGVEEICDGIDNDCDGQVDEGLGDNDGDGYSECTGDCNDANPAFHPGAADIPCDSIDQNCNGHDDCSVRFKNYGGAILDVKTGLYWLRDADCLGLGRYGDCGSTPGLHTKVSQLHSGQCGLSDGSSAGHWRVPTIAEMQSLFDKEHCQDAVWGLPCPYCSDPYASDLCLGNTLGSARWLPGDPFVDVVIWNSGPDENYYFSSEAVNQNYQRKVHFSDWTLNYYGGSPPRPSELYVVWKDYLVGSYGTNNCWSWSTPGYVWPVRSKLVDSDGDGHYRGPDCDDSDPAINPDATETCDGVDNDCDGLVDETCDYDGDGFSAEQGDCDDNDALISPDAEEACDGLDNDCDGQTDEGLILTFYLDSDEDGYGGGSSTQACTVPEGYVPNPGDCDDGDASVHPGAPDPCDGKDNNCDGIPEDRDFYFRDRDGDGYGGLEIEFACSQPEGYVTILGDCDDNDPTINPEGTEVCDSKDNDCNGYMDDGGVRTTVYRDRDGDGYGGTFSLSVCGSRQGYVESSGDCDDDDSTNFPGNTEVCDQKDNDCDGEIDEEGLPCRFLDQGDGTVLDNKTGLYWLKHANCIGASNMNYDSALYNTGLVEDGQCGLSDDSWKGAWRIPSSEEMMGLCGYCGLYCYLGNSGDTGPWSQGNAFVNVPMQSTSAFWTTTSLANGNQNIFRLTPMCNDYFSMHPDYAVYYTLYTWTVRSALVDNDGDGFLVLEDSGEGPDCDDSDAAVNPYATELCNHIDDNCADGVDEVCDWDGDGYTPNEGDCDDDNDLVNPGQHEQSNNIDDNCDGKVDERFSVMGDGTVRDNINGWYWLRDVTTIPFSTFGDAVEIVANLSDGQNGLSDGSSAGDWELPSRADLDMLVNYSYAYDDDAEGNCRVVGLPLIYEKYSELPWENMPLGPALSDGQGDKSWEEGDTFLHLDDNNPHCSAASQDLCEHAWAGGFMIPWTCLGQPWACNHNFVWTREIIEAYDGFSFDDGQLIPNKWCWRCTSVFGKIVLDEWGFIEIPVVGPIPVDPPEGTCCIAYDINRGGVVDEYFQGYYCENKLKVWPVKKG